MLLGLNRAKCTSLTRPCLLVHALLTLGAFIICMMESRFWIPNMEPTVTSVPQCPSNRLPAELLCIKYDQGIHVLISVEGRSGWKVMCAFQYCDTIPFTTLVISIGVILILSTSPSYSQGTSLTLLLAVLLVVMDDTSRL